MITGKTSTGFEFSISKKRLENYELVEALAEVDANPLLMPKVVNLLLGEQAAALKDHVRDEEGLVDVNLMGQEIREIFESQQVKN